MKVKLDGLLAVRNVFMSWGSTKKFTSKTMYKIMRIINEIKPLAEDFDKQRLAAIEKFGTPAEIDGKTVGHFEIKQENTEAIQKFQEELQSILSMEVEINFPVGTITLDELTCELSLQEMTILDAIMEQPAQA